MSFIGSSCPICGNKEYDRVLRWKWIHVLLSIITCGFWWAIIIFPYQIIAYLTDRYTLPTVNKCCRCGHKFRRQHLSLN